MENQLTPLPPHEPAPGHAPLAAPYRAHAVPAHGPENAYYGDSVDAGSAGGLLEYWRIIRRRKGTVILIAFCGAALGVLITLPQTPVYQARTSLEIQDLNENFLNMKEVSPESQVYNALSDIQTQIKILQSDSLSERTIKKLKISSPEGLKTPESRISVWRRSQHAPTEAHRCSRRCSRGRRQGPQSPCRRPDPYH